jgi:hypothetical protein
MTFEPLHRSALAVVLLAIAAPCAALAEPRLLMQHEMDAITAAGVAIEVDAFAHAIGSVASTRTDARAVATRPAEGIEVGAGFAEGQALACCGTGSSVTVGSSATGAGDVVYGNSVSRVFHGAGLSEDGTLERFTFGYSAAVQVVVSSDAPLDARALNSVRGDLAPKLFGGQAVSGDGLVTGFAFAPVHAAALRWQLARHLTGQGPDLASVASTSQVAWQHLIRAQQTVLWK